MLGGAGRDTSGSPSAQSSESGGGVTTTSTGTYGTPNLHSTQSAFGWLFRIVFASDNVMIANNMVTVRKWNSIEIVV